MTKRITIDAPDSLVILAARHLDATEGPVQIGDVVTASTRGAINRVLRYIAMAHNAPAADPGELKQTLTRAVFALKTPPPDGSRRYQAGFDAGLEAAIDAVARVFDTANDNA